MKRLQRQLQQGWGVGQAEGCQMRGWGEGGDPSVAAGFLEEEDRGARRGESRLG